MILSSDMCTTDRSGLHVRDPLSQDMFCWTLDLSTGRVALGDCLNAVPSPLKGDNA